MAVRYHCNFSGLSHQNIIVTKVKKYQKYSPEAINLRATKQHSVRGQQDNQWSPTQNSKDSESL
jgi:hypothetical protein